VRLDASQRRDPRPRGVDHLVELLVLERHRAADERVTRERSPLTTVPSILMMPGSGPMATTECPNVAPP